MLKNNSVSSSAFGGINPMPRNAPNRQDKSTGLPARSGKGDMAGSLPAPENNIGFSGRMSINLNIPRRRLLNRRRIATLQGMAIRADGTLFMYRDHRSRKARGRAHRRMLARAMADRKARG